MFSYHFCKENVQSISSLHGNLHSLFFVNSSLFVWASVGLCVGKGEHTARSVACGKMRIDAGASSPCLLSLLATGNICLREDQWGLAESGVCCLLLLWTGYFRRLESSERLTPEELELSVSVCVCGNRGRLWLQAELERRWIGVRTVDVATRSRAYHQKERA